MGRGVVVDSNADITAVGVYKGRVVRWITEEGQAEANCFRLQSTLSFAALSSASCASYCAAVVCDGRFEAQLEKKRDTQARKINPITFIFLVIIFYFFVFFLVFILFVFRSHENTLFQLKVK